jgi:hypothetical protein
VVFFEKVVPFFILLAGIMVYQTSKRKVVDKPQAVTGGRKLLYVVLLLVNGVYGGYFGAASGIITLVILTYLTNKDFVVVNAIKNVVGGVANLTALVILHVCFQNLLERRHSDGGGDVYWRLSGAENCSACPAEGDGAVHRFPGGGSGSLLLLASLF